jgi:3D (Asp-Asp-Asp) domain-containing protein
MANIKLLKIASITAFIMVLIWAVTAAVSACIRHGCRVEKNYIPFPVKERKSSFVQKGWNVWLQEGKNGYKNAAREIFMLGNSIIKSSGFYETGVLKEPVEGIVIRGISDKKHPITVPQETYAHYVFNMEATAYDPSPESNGVEWAGETCLGWKTRHGIAAVDPKVIALRRLIYVDGYGFAWTGDVGGAIKGKRIDLCYNTTEEALQWGRKKVKVYVLGNKPLSHYEHKDNMIK